MLMNYRHRGDKVEYFTMIVQNKDMKNKIVRGKDGRFIIGGFYGKHTDESRKKMSESLKKRVLSVEAKERMLKGLEFGRCKGRKHSEEAKTKISIAQKGKKKTSSKVLASLKVGREKHSRLIKRKEYWTEERRAVARRSGLKVARKMLALRGLTLPERSLGDLLDTMGVQHISQFPFGYYVIDEYIPEKCLAIEIDGKYWHNYPDGRSVDRQKDGYLKMRGLQVLRIWEDQLDVVRDFFVEGGEKYEH